MKLQPRGLANPAPFSSCIFAAKRYSSRFTSRLDCRSTFLVMFDFLAEEQASICGGSHLKRREFCRSARSARPVVAAAAAGREGGRRRPARTRQPRLHHDLQSRRPSHVDLWDMETGRPGDSRAVQADPHQVSRHRHLGDSPPAREDCRQVFARADGSPRRRGGTRCRLADHADRPTLHRRHPDSARRGGGQLPAGPQERPAAVCRAAGVDGRGGGNMPNGQAGGSARRTTCSPSTPTRRRRISRCSTCCRPTRSGLRDSIDGERCATLSMAR